MQSQASLDNTQKLYEDAAKTAEERQATVTALQDNLKKAQEHAAEVLVSRLWLFCVCVCVNLTTLECARMAQKAEERAVEAEKKAAIVEKMLVEASVQLEDTKGRLKHAGMPKSGQLPPTLLYRHCAPSRGRAGIR